MVRLFLCLRKASEGVFINFARELAKSTVFIHKVFIGVPPSVYHISIRGLQPHDSAKMLVALLLGEPIAASRVHGHCFF